jgi:hypothetical protein
MTMDARDTLIKDMAAVTPNEWKVIAVMLRAVDNTILFETVGGIEVEVADRVRGILMSTMGAKSLPNLSSVGGGIKFEELEPLADRAMAIIMNLGLNELRKRSEAGELDVGD